MKKLLKRIFIRLYNKLIEPENIEWENKNYGNIEMADVFKVIYSNNYQKICKDTKYHQLLSLISFEIIINTESESLIDFLKFSEIITETTIREHKMNYPIMELVWSKDNKYITIKLRGNIAFFKDICLSIRHNIIAKYIRNYLFPKDYISELSTISVEERFENEYIYGLDHPNKDIDILFIENDNFKNPLIGLSFKDLPTQLQPYHCITYNDRKVIIVPIKNINLDLMNLDIPEKYNTIISNIHTIIDPYKDIDEIIED